MYVFTTKKNVVKLVSPSEVQIRKERDRHSSSMGIDICVTIMELRSAQHILLPFYDSTHTTAILLLILLPIPQFCSA